jgi:hypothetical protein
MPQRSKLLHFDTNRYATTTEPPRQVIASLAVLSRSLQVRENFFADYLQSINDRDYDQGTGLHTVGFLGTRELGPADSF